MPGEPGLEVRIKAKDFGPPGARTRPVLRDVCFSARRGEFLALFGPSGAGKSTTLRIVLGLDHAFSGDVRRPPGRIGAMFQEPRLVPWLSVADNLRLVLPARELPEPDVAGLLETVGLPGAGERFPRELSLGMARRAALARAIAVAPVLLVLDEPFASLDPSLAARLAAVIEQVSRNGGATTLLATHDFGQALALADRVLVLSGHPATLAADCRVPDRADTAAIAALRTELEARFAFFGAGDPSDQA
jgi:ABC-type nitrate/sulfonate/bicarbonate transport system ATPase subunit